MVSESVEYDCSLAAALLIVELVQSSPSATTPQLLSFCTFTILEAVYEARKRLAQVQRLDQPSNN